jgi:hypothetical protein
MSNVLKEGFRITPAAYAIKQYIDEFLFRFHHILLSSDDFNEFKTLFLRLFNTQLSLDEKLILRIQPDMFPEEFRDKLESNLEKEEEFDDEILEQGYSREASNPNEADIEPKENQIISKKGGKNKKTKKNKKT